MFKNFKKMVRKVPKNLASNTCFVICLVVLVLVIVLLVRQGRQCPPCEGFQGNGPAEVVPKCMSQEEMRQMETSRIPEANRIIQELEAKPGQPDTLTAAEKLELRVKRDLVNNYYAYKEADKCNACGNGLSESKCCIKNKHPQRPGVFIFPKAGTECNRDSEGKIQECDGEGNCNRWKCSSLR